MPELPEVQTTVDGINKTAKGLVIKNIWTNYDSSYHAGKDNIKNPRYFSFFKKNVINTKILKSYRQAKNVLIDLSNGMTMLIHMKMTGHFLYGTYKKISNSKFLISKKEIWEPVENGPLKESFNRFIRLVFTLSNGKHLVLSDMRKFAKVTLIDTTKLYESEHLRTNGPEPLDKSFNFRKFKERINLLPKWPTKLILMNPKIIAGIGNIYSDEILWRANVHPLECVKNIPNKKLKAIFEAMKKTLLSGINFGGDSMSDYRNIHGKKGEFQNKHNAYQKTGEHCLKKGCKGTITRIKIGGRSTHFCNKHQKLKSLNMKHGAWNMEH